MEIKVMNRCLIQSLFLLILLVGCGSNAKPSEPIETSKPIETSVIKDIEPEGLYTCYKWIEENYDSRISFKSTESPGNAPHAIFSFDEGKLIISGASGTEIPEWYEGKYEKIDGDVYEFTVKYACSEYYLDCPAKKKEKEDLKGSFSFSNQIMYYENNKQKKCEVGRPSY